VAGIALGDSLKNTQPASVPVSAAHADFSVIVDTVLLNVGVYGHEREDVGSLDPSDFVVYEDGIRRPITYFAPANRLLSVVLLIDCSKSMSVGALEEAQKAAWQFVKQSGPDTQFSVVTFNDDVTRLVGFTTDRGKIESGLKRLHAKGATRLYDGIREALENWEGARNRSRAIVLLTDGRDEMSSTKLEQLKTLLEESEVILFPCGVYSPAYRRLFQNGRKYYTKPQIEENLNPVWVLNHLSGISGTSALFPEPGTPLSQIFAVIVSELENRYILGFEPAPALLPGTRYRSVQVEIKNRLISGSRQRKDTCDSTIYTGLSPARNRSIRRLTSVT